MLKLLRVRERKYIEDLEEFLEEAKKTFNEILLIVVFGSIVRGFIKPYPESDVDVLVVSRGLPKRLLERRAYTSRLRKRPLAVEDIWLTPEELWEGIKGGWGVILDALSEGLPLYDPENLFRDASSAIASRYERMGRIWRLRPRYSG